MNFVDIIFSSLLANHLLFFHFLGVSEFLEKGAGASLVRRTAMMALLLAVAAVAFWVPDRFLLQPFHLEYLRTVLLLTVLWPVTLVFGALNSGPQGTASREFLLHSLLVGGVLLVGSSSPDVVEVLTAALAVALGYGMALILLVAIFQRLERERIPGFIQGLPLQLITLGLVWLVLQGLGFAFAGPVS